MSSLLSCNFRVMNVHVNCPTYVLNLGHRKVLMLRSLWPELLGSSACASLVGSGAGL